MKTLPCQCHFIIHACLNTFYAIGQERETIHTGALLCNTNVAMSHPAIENMELCPAYNVVLIHGIMEQCPAYAVVQEYS